jgi:putative oligomerization/nucleic acid binding protein
MFMRRRRPLMRAAVVGGVAYHAGKKVQEGRYEDEETQARLDQLEQQQQYAAQQAPAQPQSSGGISDAAIEQLKKLSELKDAGVLTDVEFEEQKRKLLNAS